MKQKSVIKNAKYLSNCLAEGVVFLPFVVGSMGGFGEEAELVLQYIASRKAIKEDIDFGVALERLRIRLSIVVQKCQAAAIIAASPENLVAF